MMIAKPMPTRMMTETDTIFSSYIAPKCLSNWHRLTLVLSLLYFWFGIPVAAIDFLAEGEKALSQNQLEKAQTYFEAALAQGSTDERICLALGLVYQKKGLSEQAEKIFRKGSELAGPMQYLLAYNLGIVAFNTKKWAQSEEAFSQALRLKPDFFDALLNRANTRLENKNWQGAIVDFTEYQAQQPNNPQKAKIDRVLALLKEAQQEHKAQELAEAFQKKQEEERLQAEKEAALAAEQQRQAQELARKAEEKKKQEEEQKKQQEILSRIRDSLQDADEDSKVLKTGPAGVKSEEGDFTLE